MAMDFESQQCVFDSAVKKDFLKSCRNVGVKIESLVVKSSTPA